MRRRLRTPSLSATIALLVGACGAPIEPTPDCDAFVACTTARDVQLGITTDVVRFQPGGACWGNPEIADLCDRGCRSGMAWLRDAGTDLPSECAP